MTAAPIQPLPQAVETGTHSSKQPADSVMATGPRRDRTAELMGRLLLNREQVAALLGVSEATVETLHRTGRLKGAQVGKELRWQPAWVQKYADELEPIDS